MNHKEFIDSLRKDQLNTVYLFTGTEELIMDSYIDIVRKKYIDDSLLALNYFEITRNNDFQSILDSCETLPFVSPRKLIYISDVNDLQKHNKESLDKLVDYLEDIPDFNIVIIKDKNNKLKKNTRLYKRVNKLGGVVEFTRLNRQDLLSWLLKLVREESKTISNQDLAYFIDRTGYLEYGSEKSLFELKNEMNKIINASKDQEITRTHIDENLIDSLNNNIFDFLDQLALKNRSRALDLFDEIYRSKEPIPRVLYMVIRQYRLLLQYKVYRSRGYNDFDTRAKMKISPFEFKKLAAKARNYREEELEQYLTYLLEEDIKQKTSSYNEKLAMETLIIKLTC